MNFGKQFLASLLGSTLALVIAGSLLIFIFVGALVGGLASAFEGATDGSEMDLDFGGLRQKIFEQICVKIYLSGPASKYIRTARVKIYLNRPASKYI